MQFPSSWKLPEQIKQRFGYKTSGKQRAMVAEGHLLLVLHKAPQPQQREMKVVFFWRQPDGEWLYSGRGQGLITLNKHLEEYSFAEGKLIQLYETARSADDYFTILEEIAPLLRATQNLYATLQSAREAMREDRDLIGLRDWAYELERGLDLLHTDTKNALDFQMAKKAEEQARLSLQSVRASDRLNTLIAIFLPLTAIASVFGMNLPHGLENSSIYLFWLVLLFGIGLGYAIRGWVFKDL